MSRTRPWPRPAVAAYRSLRPAWADCRRTGMLVDRARKKLHLALEITERGDKPRSAVPPGRWVAERTPGRPTRSRRPARDHETLPATSESFEKPLCPSGLLPSPDVYVLSPEVGRLLVPDGEPCGAGTEGFVVRPHGGTATPGTGRTRRALIWRGPVGGKVTEVTGGRPCRRRLLGLRGGRTGPRRRGPALGMRRGCTPWRWAPATVDDHLDNGDPWAPDPEQPPGLDGLVRMPSAAPPWSGGAMRCGVRLRGRGWGGARRPGGRIGGRRCRGGCSGRRSTRAAVGAFVS